ncbi:EF hand [Dictyocaulus viviparus]|uniref:EF hand n=1 Tax=Dictyocaulus viviparus TaxID=29172 RepID=A0A0D8XHZ0_DICVI|nr:EF hand [Dictyocaulus viviparus]
MMAETLQPDVICQRYVLNDNQISETFDLLDVDKDGRLSRNEIAALFRTIKVEPTRMELDFIFKEMDADDTGKIGKEEFIRYMRCPPIRRTTLKELENQFRIFDSDGDGWLTEEEMTLILRETSDLNDTEVIHRMFSSTDTDGDGLINFAEFVKMMKE